MIVATESDLCTQVQADFPTLDQEVNGKRLVYLDSAATAQKPQAVIDSQSDFYQDTNANVHRGVHYLSQRATDLFEDARETVRRFLNAKQTQEVVFTKGCTESINLVSTCIARSQRLNASTPDALRIKEGDTILVSTMEHHSNIVPWQILAEETGAKVVPIPITDDCEIDMDAYAKLLKEHRVKLVAIVHVSNSVGTINPVKEIVRMAHEAGAIAMVDGAQAGPHWLVDVQDVDADFYTLSCHKMYAPTGIGVLYGKFDLLDKLGPYQGGGGMIRQVTFEKTTYADLPDRYEPGTPNIAGAIGLGASIKYMEALGTENTSTPQRPNAEIRNSPDTVHGSRLTAHDSKIQNPKSKIQNAMSRIHAHESELASYAESLLRDIPGVRIIGTAKEKAGIVSFAMEQAHPHDIGTILDYEGVAIRAGHHCCQPLMKRMGVPATARASFALYNSREDVETLARAVGKVAEVFG
jgi:cysteine desulfurase/selenocysteine lyase